MTAKVEKSSTKQQDTKYLQRLFMYLIINTKIYPICQLFMVDTKPVEMLLWFKDINKKELLCLGHREFL